MSIVSTYSSKLFEFLQRPRAVKWQIVFYIISFSCYDRLRAGYEQIHGWAIAGAELQDEEEAKRAKQVASDQQTGAELKWRRFPHYPIYLYLLRKLSTIWVCYIACRYSLGPQLVELARHYILELALPSHCYLLGRFIFDESVADLLSAFFAVVFLLNRVYATLGPPIYSSLIYSLLLDERDAEFIYARFSPAAGLHHLHHQPISALERPSKRLAACEQLLLSTMCYRIHHSTRVTYKLRANRTSRANLALRKCVARMSIMVACVIVPVALILAPFDMVQYLLDSRYLRTYPKCDPELELMQSRGELAGESSMTMTRNHVISIPFDILENTILWIECGLVATIVPSIVHLVNYDLVLHWAGIECKIYQLESAVRHEVGQDELNPIGWSNQFGLTRQHSPTGPGSPRHSLAGDFRLRHELVAEMHDFFAQVQQASKFIAYILNFTILGSLSLTMLVTYHLKGKSLNQLPWQLLTILAVIALAMCLGSYSCMLVHSACQRSYTRFCSLVANDPMKHKLNYGTLLEQYREHRDCYWLLDLYPFLPSTLLTFGGWFISCFVIVSEVLGRYHLR